MHVPQINQVIGVKNITSPTNAAKKKRRIIIRHVVIDSLVMVVYMCVCVCERERERERESNVTYLFCMHIYGIGDSM